MSLQTIAKALKAANIPVRSVTEGDDSVDSEIEVTDRLSIQVGWPTPFHVTVSCWVNGGEDLESRDPRKPEDIAGIIADLKSFEGVPEA